MNAKRIASFPLLLLVSSNASAQLNVGQACNAGAGAKFGITSYECVSCRIDQKAGKSVYHFAAEPVILELSSKNGLEAGDVVVAVNGSPITTEAGAAQFVNPPDGNSVVTVRRGRSEVQVSVPKATGCWVSGSKLLFDSIGKFKTFRDLRAKPSFSIRASPKYGFVRDSATGKVGLGFLTSGQTTGELGIGLQCVPTCALLRSRDGGYYLGFTDYPRIADFKDSGAPRAFVIGDRIVSIDGVSILTEDGAMKLRALSGDRSHVVVVERDGKKSSVTIPAQAIKR